MNSAHLALGSSVNSAEFNEGDDAYLECQVDSNPAPLDIVWEKDVGLNCKEIDSMLIFWLAWYTTGGSCYSRNSKN